MKTINKSFFATMNVNLKNLTTMKKLKNLKSLIPLFFVALLFASANAQDVVTRETPDFSGVDAGGVFNVFLTQAPVCSVELETEGVDPDDIITKVKNGVLVLSVDGSLPRGARVTVKLTAPFFNSIKASGVVNVKSTNTIEHEVFQLDVSGASKIDMDLVTEQLKSDISGASNVYVRGKATMHKVDISGASFLKGFELESEVVSVDASGASKIEVNPLAKLTAKLSGTSNLVYKTDPADKNITVSGLAKVGIKADGKVHYHDPKDTLRIRVGGQEVWLFDDDSSKKRTTRKRKPKFRNNWSGIDFGMNAYISPKQSFGLQKEAEFLELEHNKSWVLNFNLFQKNFPIISNNVGIFTGVGFGFNNYRLNDKSVTLIYNKDNIDYVVEDEIKMSRNKLVLSHLNIPLMLEVQTHGTKKYHRFNIAAGVNLGILMSSYTTQRYDIDGHKMKRKVNENYHISPFRYDLTARIGYSGINLFASYALNTLFKTDKGPELYPISIGISLVN